MTIISDPQQIRREYIKLLEQRDTELSQALDHANKFLVVLENLTKIYKEQVELLAKSIEVHVSEKPYMCADLNEVLDTIHYQRD